MTSAFDIIPQVSFTLRHQTLQCPLRCAARCIAHCTALLSAPCREAPHFRPLPPAAGKESRKDATAWLLLSTHLDDGHPAALASVVAFAVKEHALQASVAAYGNVLPYYVDGVCLAPL